METAEYWPMAQEYSIWNAAIGSLHFWAEDLNPVTLGIASECIYTTFFWTPTSHMLCQQSEDVLFGCFVIALNAAFTQQLSLADEGYESGSDTADLPTPLQKTPHIHHVSSIEHASFNPVHTTPHNTIPMTPCSSPQTPTRPVCQCLSFSLNSTWIQTALQYTQTAQMKRKKIFRWYHWMMSKGHWRKYLKELFAYMKMDYHTTYANIHALMGAMTLFHTWIA